MGSDRRREKLKVLRCRIELQVGGRNEEQVRNKCVWPHSGRPEVYKLTPWCQHSFLKWALFHFKIGFNIKVPVERQMGRWKKKFNSSAQLYCSEASAWDANLQRILETHPVCRVSEPQRAFFKSDTKHRCKWLCGQACSLGSRSDSVSCLSLDRACRVRSYFWVTQGQVSTGAFQTVTWASTVKKHRFWKFSLLFTSYVYLDK